MLQLFCEVRTSPHPGVCRLYNHIQYIWYFVFDWFPIIPIHCFLAIPCYAVFAQIQLDFVFWSNLSSPDTLICTLDGSSYTSRIHGTQPWPFSLIYFIFLVVLDYSCRLSLVVVYRGFSLVAAQGFLLLRSWGFRVHGLTSCGARA